MVNLCMRMLCYGKQIIWRIVSSISVNVVDFNLAANFLYSVYFY